jgi:CheY-like chemotaxis protein
MPGFSGHEFIRAVRALSTVHNTPAIALTAFSEPGQRRLALESGFQAYLLKPFDATRLVEEIARLAAG